HGIYLFKWYSHTLKTLLEFGRDGFFLNILNGSIKTEITNSIGKGIDVGSINTVSTMDYTVYEFIIDELVQELENFNDYDQIPNILTSSFLNLKNYARDSLNIPLWTDDWKKNNNIDKNKFIPNSH